MGPLSKPTTGNREFHHCRPRLVKSVQDRR